MYNNGGQWLNAVFPTGSHNQVTGFVHAEDHYWLPGQGFTGGGRAYKSIVLGELRLNSHTIVYYQCVVRTWEHPGLVRDRY